MVKEVISWDMSTMEQIQNMSRRSRAYIKAYYLFYCGMSFHEEVNGDNVWNNSTKKRRGEKYEISFPQIEQVMKSFKCHRTNLSWDAAFVRPFIKCKYIYILFDKYKFFYQQIFVLVGPVKYLMGYQIWHKF